MCPLILHAVFFFTRTNDCIDYDVVVDSLTQSGSSVNNTAEVIALGDSRYMPDSGGKRGSREEDNRSGNIADVSSELHTGALCFY